jgi:hypothetical protein
MVECAAGQADPMEARRVAGESFPDRAEASFDPANAQALRMWLVEMNWLPAVDGRDFNGFKAGIMKKGKFRFDDEECYQAGHEHSCCMCRFEQKAAWSEQMNEGGTLRRHPLPNLRRLTIEPVLTHACPQPGAARTTKKITRTWTLFRPTVSPARTSRSSTPTATRRANRSIRIPPCARWPSARWATGAPTIRSDARFPPGREARFRPSLRPEARGVF